MNIFKWIKQVVLIAISTTLVACEERILVPQSWTTLLGIARKQSGACSIFPSLDRTGFGGLSLSAPDSAGRILAGYTTTFAPGTPPFACDRLHQFTQQGVFLFNVASLRGSVPVPFRGAVLEISNFTPVGRGINIIDAEPWGLGFGEGWLGSSVPRNTCQFKVVRANQAWANGTAGGWGRATIATENLATARATFTAPMATNVNLDVSQEVGQWFRGDRPELGFAIMPADSSINAKASNSCVGLFTVRLRAFFGEDES
ncbi:MAG TPA: hypothetical protein IGS40_12490 [Trichormus sp. M33_DOE_039]|nr:hypothetical protein [Trichormus sp. M33_DOE_039]